MNPASRSLMTPTISHGCGPKSGLPIRLPTGSRPGKYRRASASLMMTTDAALVLSRPVKKRPRARRCPRSGNIPDSPGAVPRPAFRRVWRWASFDTCQRDCPCCHGPHPEAAVHGGCRFDSGQLGQPGQELLNELNPVEFIRVTRTAYRHVQREKMFWLESGIDFVQASDASGQ